MGPQVAVEQQCYLKQCNVNSLFNNVNKTWDRRNFDSSITKGFLGYKIYCVVYWKQEMVMIWLRQNAE